MKKALAVLISFFVSNINGISLRLDKKIVKETKTITASKIDAIRIVKQTNKEFNIYQ